MNTIFMKNMHTYSIMLQHQGINYRFLPGEVKEMPESIRGLHGSCIRPVDAPKTQQDTPIKKEEIFTIPKDILEKNPNIVKYNDIKNTSNNETPDVVEFPKFETIDEQPSIIPTTVEAPNESKNESIDVSVSILSSIPKESNEDSKKEEISKPLAGKRINKSKAIKSRMDRQFGYGRNNKEQ